MRARVSGLTSGLLRSARDTVACDTCAMCAMSSEVGLIGLVGNVVTGRCGPGRGSPCSPSRGGVPGMLLSLGISAWDANAHEQERPDLQVSLRADLDGALRTALWQLLHDRTAGVLAPVTHMAAQLDGALPAPPAPPLIEAGPVQGLF